MTGWTLLDTHPTQGRTFYRPLDLAESYLLWGGLCDGAMDCILRVQLHLLNGEKDAYLLSDANIVKALLSAKRRYPLVGATLQGSPGSPLSGANSKADILTIAANPHFVVRENDLVTLREGEIVFGSVASTEEVDSRVAGIFDGPRPVSPDLLHQMYVYRETGRDDVLHVMTLCMHCVTDVTAASAFLRYFLDLLARGGDPEAAQVPLEDRLAKVTSLEDREPIQLRSLSPAKRRWRKAAASIIFQLRFDKIQGGHTLPRRFTSLTSYTPARSRESFVFLTPAETATVLANCRRHKVTFGNAYLVLAQVAMTRVLYRQYLRGEISEEEWEYRREQAHTIAGPFSLRPYLNKAWYESGGGGEFLTSLGTFFYQLPFMTLGSAHERYKPHGQNLGLSDGAPPFSELLSFDRFLHRAQVVKNQANGFFKHPLFLEMVYATTGLILQYLQRTTSEWLERIEAAKNGDQEDEDEDVLTPMDIPIAVAHGGSSFGNLDSVMPREYPLPPAHPLSPLSPVPHPSMAGYVTGGASSPQTHSATSKASTTDIAAPKMVLRDIRTVYHSGPGEIYLGAWSSGGRLRMYSLYDRNVYEEALVKEWLDEIKGAVLWYLGRPQESRQVQQSGPLGTGLGAGGQAKL